jgi:putative transposase
MSGDSRKEGRMTRYLCDLLNVSRSGYCNYIQAADTRLERALLDTKAGELIKKAFHKTVSSGYKGHRDE